MQMRTFSIVVSALLLAIIQTALPSATVGRTLVVGNNPVTCPNANFTTIQAAVNAAPSGAAIVICPGTYVEQVTINKPVDINADPGAVLMPSAMQANGASLTDASPLATAILVTSANGVTINGLIVDGTNSGISGCAPILVGIAFQNSSGTIDHVTVRNFKLNGTNLDGCQSGLGIFVQSAGGATSNVTIERNTVHDFQKNGITVNEVGTQATVTSNVVTGIGPTPGAAQNGIQIGFGAAGSVTKNTVTNNVWSTCASVSSCAAIATNILVTESDNVQVTSNTVGINNVGIFYAGNSADIERNETFATSVFDGIHLEGNQGTVSLNQVFNSAESGIFLSGNDNTIELNVITEAAIGILKATGSTGNIIQGNQFLGTPIQVQDPAEANLAKIISPVR
jgi:nitrous oxidase accessory protein NosD